MESIASPGQEEEKTHRIKGGRWEKEKEKKRRKGRRREKDQNEEKGKKGLCVEKRPQKSPEVRKKPGRGRVPSLTLGGVREALTGWSKA